MTLEQYIYNLRSTLPSLPTHAEWATVEPMLSYARAVAKGAEAVAEYRNKLIAKEINLVVTRDAQIAIMFNKETNPEEYQKYQEFRITCKTKVDDYLAGLQAELNKQLEGVE